MTLVLTAPGKYVHPDFYELARYLGPSFNLNWCDASDEKGRKDAASGKYKDNDDFVRNTFAFLYQNIGLSVQGVHRPYLAKLLGLCADKGAVSIIDVGAGGGQVGLALHTLGFRVSFADLYSHSLLFLLWRLRERRLDLPVYLMDEAFEAEIPKHAVAICFDVLEHCQPDEQLRLLYRLANMADTVFVNLIRDDGELDKLHFPVDIEHLTQYVSDHWLTWAKDYYPDGEGKFKQRLLVYGRGMKSESETE